jgi:hypothetical protein
MLTHHIRLSLQGNPDTFVFADKVLTLPAYESDGFTVIRDHQTGQIFYRVRGLNPGCMYIRMWLYVNVGCMRVIAFKYRVYVLCLYINMDSVLYICVYIYIHTHEEIYQVFVMWSDSRCVESMATGSVM